MKNSAPFLLLLAALIPSLAKADYCVAKSQAWFSSLPASVWHSTLGRANCENEENGNSLRCRDESEQELPAQYIRHPNFSAIALQTKSGRIVYCYYKTNCTFGSIPDDVRPEQLEIAKSFALKDECRIRR